MIDDERPPSKKRVVGRYSRYIGTNASEESYPSGPCNGQGYFAHSQSWQALWMDFCLPGVPPEFFASSRRVLQYMEHLFFSFAVTCVGSIQVDID